MTLGELIKNYRVEHELSQRQFATICGLSNGYIAMLERGENPQTHQPIVPTIPRMKAVADGMGLSLNDLFRMIDDMAVDISEPSMSDTERELLSNFRKLSQPGKEYIMQTMMLAVQTYSKKNSAVPNMEAAL